MEDDVQKILARMDIRIGDLEAELKELKRELREQARDEKHRSTVGKRYGYA